MLEFHLLTVLLNHFIDPLVGQLLIDNADPDATNSAAVTTFVPKVSCELRSPCPCGRVIILSQSFLFELQLHYMTNQSRPPVN